ncbi:MAG TPA: inositol monophosphatase family protein [bacterium]|nr:inositol monophosphatase family protein [bacterium]
MKDFIVAAEAACRIAGKLQLEGLKRDKQIEFKGSINLVTDVDKACEKAIVEVLQGRFPEHDILAEEGSGRRKNSEYKWIIDPLDGTTNYAHGYRLFCVSIALEHKGEIVVGAVFEPNRDEMFLAEKGGGARLNGEKLAVSQVADLNHAMLATGFAYNVRETANNNLDHFQKFLMKSQAIRRDGVAAVDLCYVAAGRFDGFWELNLFPWDVAAGYLMIQEAGGKVSDFRGKAFDVYSKEILASNGRLHPAMSSLLSPG